MKDTLSLTEVTGEIELEQRILELLSNQVGETHVTRLDLIKEFLISIYGEEKINLDAIDAKLQIASNEKTFENTCTLSYGNLYTYVLLNNICIPYYEWIYDSHYFGNEYVYTLNEGVGAKELRSGGPAKSGSYKASPRGFTGTSGFSGKTGPIGSTGVSGFSGTGRPFSSK